MTTTSTAADAEASVQAAYDRVVAALAASDVATLDTLVAEDCTIVGPKGYLIGRSDWIGSHNGEVFAQISLYTVETRTHAYPGTAVRLDLQRSECLFHAERIAGLFRVMSVWREGPGSWQLSAIQYTAVAPEAAPGDEASTR